MADETNTEFMEKLISLVKARPVLYDRTLIRNTDCALKQELWLEVCEILIPGWIHKNLSEQIQISLKVQKLWQEITASYEKEFSQKKIIQLIDAQASRQVKFVYLDKLDFLKPMMRFPPASSYVNVTDTNDAATNHHRSEYVQRNTHRNQLNTDPYLRMVNVDSSKGIDEDKHFLLSLIPSLQKMSSTKKIRVKMMFLKAIHDMEEEIQQTLPNTQLTGNQPRQSPSPLTHTVTSDNLIDQSNQPNVIPTPQTNENQLSRVRIKGNYLLRAQPSLQLSNGIKDEVIIDDN